MSTPPLAWLFAGTQQSAATLHGALTRYIETSEAVAGFIVKPGSRAAVLAKLHAVLPPPSTGGSSP